MGHPRRVFDETPLDWQGDAACRDADPERFYILGPMPADVRAICNSCPVQRQCLDFAMRVEGDEASTARRFGVWGGTTAIERARLARNGWPA